jgi:predicted flap endonuclease-1-like 5' DNA nuclease
MKAFKVFILGLLYGWLLKAAIDRIYRENEIEDVRNENASLRDYIRSLESRLHAKPIEAEAPKRATPRAASVRAEKDNLKVIKGIGPAIEKKLNEAGVLTFAALAQLTTEELEAILGNARRLAREGDLIDQAKKLAAQ